MQTQGTTPKLMTLRIIFLSMLMTPIIFGVVLQVTPMDPQPGQQLASVMGLLAVASIPLVLVLRKMTMGDFALTQPDLPPGRMEVDPGEVEAALSSAMARYQTGCIVGFAVAESVGIYGFAGAFLTGNPTYALPFLAGSMALIGVQFPRAAGVLSLVPQDMRAHVERAL